ncbi:MAG: type II toxin-antitoxin system HicA family toxin [Terriglobia bacterium]
MLAVGTSTSQLPACERLALNPSPKVLNALLRIGWRIKRTKRGSHIQLSRPGFPDFTWPFHDGVEIGPKMLARITKHTGLRPENI